MSQLLDGNDRIGRDVERGLAGGVDGAAFGERLEPFRRELHVYCYQLLGSFDGADDLVQETWARAWQQRDRLVRSAWLRAWLYRIATHACLDALASSSRSTSMGTMSTGHPGAVAVSKDSIDLAFIVALQTLPPRQRAALILRDVVGWSLRETAGLLDTTMVAANSALQRARATLPPVTHPNPRRGAL